MVQPSVYIMLLARSELYELYERYLSYSLQLFFHIHIKWRTAGNEARISCLAKSSMCEQSMGHGHCMGTTTALLLIFPFLLFTQLMVVGLTGLNGATVALPVVLATSLEVGRVTTPALCTMAPTAEELLMKLKNVCSRCVQVSVIRQVISN